MKASTVPALFFLQAVFWILSARRLESRDISGGKYVTSVSIWLLLLAIWAGVTSVFSLTGVYVSASILGLYPGLWLPMVPVVLSAGLLAVWPSFRVSMTAIASDSASGSLVAVHALRLAAIGGLYKAMRGQMPAAFTYGVGVPDVLFGLSALVLSSRGGSRLPAVRLILWNLIGLAVIVPSAPLLFQLSLPGPAYRIAAIPNGLALLEFPMVLAPTLVVPLFTFTNALVAGTLWLEGGLGSLERTSRSR